MWRPQKSEISTRAGKQSNATKRLLKDLKQMRSNTVPTVGVTALPLNDNIFTWHCNVRGPKGTPYEGGLFHLILVFPETYPIDPPDVTVCTSIPHPNIFGSRVCLDMLQPGDEQDAYVGWSSAYSVESILIQLQSFFFESSAGVSVTQCRKAVEEAQKYQCPSCPHRPLRSWPPLPSIEEDAFILKKSETEIVREELVCYHSKRTFEEDTLGYGLSFSRNIKTGSIENISSPIELIGIRAFMRGTTGGGGRSSTGTGRGRFTRGARRGRTSERGSGGRKLGIRKSSANVPFSHWLPVWLNKEHGQKAMHLAKRALSMIKKGNTKSFEPEMALDVFPKLMNTMIVSIMKGQIHHSIRALEGYCQFHRMFIGFLMEYPELHVKAQNIVEEFIENPEARHKDSVPSLGELLPLVSVSKYTWSDIAEPIVRESLDRGVFWVVKDYPQMEQEDPNPDIDKKRPEVFLGVNIVGYRLLMFHNFFLSRVVRPTASLEEMATAYDELYGRPSSKMQEGMQHAFREIKKVETYNDYFSHVGLPIVNKEELVALLLHSVKNSREKGYHGATGPKVPTPEELAEEAARKNVQLSALCTTLPGGEGEGEEGSSTSATAAAAAAALHNKEDEWKTLCENRWGVVSCADQVASMDNPWKRTYLKSNLEDFIARLNARPDFKQYYTTLELSAHWITHLEVKLFNPKKLKSGFYFLTGLLSKLVQVHSLKLTRGDGTLGLKGVKALAKGLKNNPNSLRTLDLSFLGITPGDKACEILAEGILASPNLESLDLQGNPLGHLGVAGLSRVLWEHKSLTSLNMCNCSVDSGGGQELADGLLANKKLKEVNLSRNPLYGQGLRAVIYNLAFSPTIEDLNLSRVVLPSSEDLSEALSKLLRISQTLKTLNLWKTPVANSLTKPVMETLAANKSLETLDLGEVGSLSVTSLTELGKALAVNQTLKNLNIASCGIKDSGVETIYRALLVEKEKEEEDEASRKERMRREMLGDVEKVEAEVSLHLEQLDMSNNNLRGHGKGVGKLIMMGKTLHTLNLENCYLSAKAGENIGLALESNTSLKTLRLRGNELGKEGAKFLSSGLKHNTVVEFLDISGNQIGVSGARALSEVLASNASIHTLNMFGNLIDVDGARALAQAIATNKTLTHLDIGVNRIRDKGAIALAKALSSNKSITKLGVKLNHIGDTGIMQLANVIAKKSGVKELALAGNHFADETLLSVSEILGEGSNPCSMDLENRLALLDPDRVQRSIWVTPLPQNISRDSIKKLFYENACGVVLNVSVHKHKTVTNFSQGSYAFVEFGHKNSVEASLDLSATGKALIDGRTVRIYRAGTGNVGAGFA